MILTFPIPHSFALKEAYDILVELRHELRIVISGRGYKDGHGP